MGNYRLYGVSRARPQAGFTLIEIMITVAIIGVLVSLALPTYSNYLTRSRITAGLALASSAQENVIELATMGSSSGLAQGYGTGLSAPTPTDNVAAVTVDPSTGIIQVTFTAAAGGGTLYLNPYTNGPASASPLPDATQPFAPPSVSAILWQCAAAGASIVPNSGGLSGTTPAQFAPANCR